MSIKKDIKRAQLKYISYRSSCDTIAIKAQEFINWDDDVSCEYMPSDGICILINHKLCPVEVFFELAKNGCISEEIYSKNCI